MEQIGTLAADIANAVIYCVEVDSPDEDLPEPGRSAASTIRVSIAWIDQPLGHPPDDAGPIHDLAQQQRAGVGARMIRSRLDLHAAVEGGRQDR